MALRRTMLNGGGFGDRYAYPYRTTNKIAPVDISFENMINARGPILNGGTDVFKINHVAPFITPLPLTQAERLDLARVNAVQVVETKNGNGETVKVALDENGEVVATKKAPNIMPLVVAAAAALFFLM